ncbi:hypothetical protein ACWDHW_09770 [Streptomyces melanosporofaciens]|uniref:hypothetical protein n=1 Tax=unclassified Streptomyces TaxID=2593676 RepID=UPI0036B22B4A
MIHQSGRGPRYVSIRGTGWIAKIGAAASVGSIAEPYDNAMVEALTGAFKRRDNGKREPPGGVLERGETISVALHRAT